MMQALDSQADLLHYEGEIDPHDPHSFLLNLQCWFQGLGKAFAIAKFSTQRRGGFFTGRK
jgi:hypothetical protein